jgi:hypothetical protein
MTRRTIRRTSKQIQSIPALRAAFEGMEQHVRDVSAMTISEKMKIKRIRDEWNRIFSRALTVASAEALLKEYASRTTGGTLSPAPLDHATRAGLYLAPGQIPDADGGIPLSGQAGGAYGSYHSYVDSGFSNPAMAQSYDPVDGQSPWPTPSPTTGSNLVGGRRAKPSRSTKRRVRGGAFAGTYVGAVLDQAFQRPISSSAPPGVLQDMQDMWHGGKVGDSPDQVQRAVHYRVPE